MKALRVIVLMLALLAPALACFANGSIYAPESTGMNEPEPRITDQRALISWNEGREVMVLESIFEHGQYSAIIIPVPGKPDLIEELPEGYFANLATQHQIIIISHPNDFVLALGGLIAAVLGFGLYQKFKKGDKWTPRQFCAAVMTSLVISLVPIYMFLPVSGNPYPRIEDPEKFKVEQVNEFQTTVFSPDDPDGVANWLEKAELSHPSYEIERYAKKGWYFVAVKLRTSHERAKTRPIMIRFRSEKPIYPLWLTAQQGGSINLDLYTVGEGQAVVPGLQAASSEMCGYLTLDDQEPLIFHDEKWVTRLVGKYDLARRPGDIELKWGDQVRTELVGWTIGGKAFGVLERMIFSALLCLVFLAPFLISAHGLAGTLGRTALIGSAFGLVFSIPIFFEPTISNASPLTRSWSGISGYTFDAARSISEATSKSEADRAWNDKVLAELAGSNFKETYGIYHSDEDGAKLTTIGLDGEPIFVEVRWKNK